MEAFNSLYKELLNAFRTSVVVITWTETTRTRSYFNIEIVFRLRNGKGRRKDEIL